MLRSHRSAVRSLAIFNGCLLSGSYDRTVKMWDLADEGKCVGSLGTRGSVWALTTADAADGVLATWRQHYLERYPERRALAENPSDSTKRREGRRPKG